MIIFKVKSFFIAWIFYSLFIPTACFAWGHLEFVGNNEWSQSTLTYALVKRHEIRFCVDVQDPKRFPPRNISMQVKRALQVWLSATGKYAKSPIKEVKCNGEFADLRVKIGPESEFTEMSGYQVPQADGERFYSLVKLNSDYTYVEDKQHYQVVDFAQIVPIPIGQMPIIEEVSEKKQMNVGDFASKYKVHYQKAYLSSYKMLLHEIGHSFGLCDTEESLFKYCDIKYRTQDRPASVMNQADFFYLTDDDKAGLTALIKRYEMSLSSR